MRYFPFIVFSVLLFNVGPALGVDDSDPRVTHVVRSFRKAGPAVVNISTEQVQKVGIFGGDPFEDIFPFPGPFVREVPVQSLGSGVVIHPRGYIITNAHVVRKAQKIAVTFSDKTRYEARVISADPRHDLAVLKIDPPDGKAFPNLSLGRSDDLMVGETVIAVGNPLGLANTVTTGVISALDRTLTFDKGMEYTGLIQIDAPINPGNSGGPLLNIHGELIGINTAIRADAQNIGFAIAVDTLAGELARLLDFEQINRVLFGATVTPSRASGGGDELSVTAVRGGAPAEGKLLTGDRILAVDETPVRQISDYTCAMLEAKPGSTVRLKVLRDGNEQTVAVTVVAKPQPDGKALARRLLGMTLRPVTPRIASELRLPAQSGLLVVGIDSGGPAEATGIQLKDVLFQVGQYYVKDNDELGMVLEGVQSGQAVPIGVARGNMRAWVQIVAH